MIFETSTHYIKNSTIYELGKSWEELKKFVEIVFHSVNYNDLFNLIKASYSEFNTKRFLNEVKTTDQSSWCDIGCPHCKLPDKGKEKKGSKIKKIHFCCE
jgi:hypothetical protein